MGGCVNRKFWALIAAPSKKGMGQKSSDGTSKGPRLLRGSTKGNEELVSIQVKKEKTTEKRRKRPGTKP